MNNNNVTEVDCINGTWRSINDRTWKDVLQEKVYGINPLALIITLIMVLFIGLYLFVMVTALSLVLGYNMNIGLYYLVIGILSGEEIKENYSKNKAGQFD